MGNRPVLLGERSRRRRSLRGLLSVGAIGAMTAAMLVAAVPAQAADCPVTVTRGQEWGDRFNVSVAVSGTSTWTVSIALGSGQSVQNSWNASVSGTTGTVTATPNGNGNSFGFTVMKGGNNATPSASCSTTGTTPTPNPNPNPTPTPNPNPNPNPTPASCSAGYVALTFDDGPNSSTTNQILNTLRQYSATAVMFPTGSNAQSFPSLMQAYKNAGVQIGNHSWDHPHLINMSQAEVQSQLSRTQQAIQQTAGVTPTLFRPPYGEVNSTVSSVASSLGLRTIIWDVDSQDYNNVSAQQIRQAASRLTNGQVILMHDWPAATAQALPGILDDLRSRNLCTGHISASTGRAVAPSGGGTTNPPPTTPPPTTPPPGNGACTVTATRGQDWGDRFNVSYSVSGSSSWTVSIPLASGQSLQNSWNASVTGTTGTITARPNGSGTSFGITVLKGGNNTTPSATCSG